MNLRSAALDSLALGPGAGEGDIRSAYRRLALRYHPDASGDPRSAKRFLRVAKAYKVLVAAEPEASPPPRSTFRSVEDAGTDLFALGQVLASDPAPEARGAAARALGLSGRNAAYVFLRRAFYDPCEEVALEAVRAVALLGSMQAEGEVAALFSRSAASLKRKMLALALATGERLFRSTLAAAAKDSDPDFRVMAAEGGKP